MTLSPIGAVLRWTGASLIRHALLYAALVAFSIAVSWLIEVTLHQPEGVTLWFTQSIVPSIATCIINAVCLTDWTRDAQPVPVWSRVLDRTWAVIIIDFIGTLVVALAQQAIGSDLIYLLLAIPLLLLAAATMFADVVAVADEGTPWWMLIVRAFGGSIVTVFSRGLFQRATLLLIVELLLGYASLLVGAELSARKVAHAEFWASVPLGMITLPAIQALIAFTYLDAVTDASKRPCSE
jgi:hypothetical protein